MTIITDIITIVFGLLFVANLVLQIKSMIKLVGFLTKNKWTRVSINVIIAIVSLTYLHDITIMLALTWGLPAYTMVLQSINSKQNQTFVN